MKNGILDIDDIKNGSININKVYNGTVLVWERGGGPVAPIVIDSFNQEPYTDMLNGLNTSPYYDRFVKTII